MPWLPVCQAHIGFSSGAVQGHNWFSLERLKPGVYRVIPREIHGPGQYALLTNVGFEAEKTGRLFDFGVEQ